MLTLHHISYLHPDKELLFDQLGFSIQNGQKVALIGNNGSGKSTLLKIIAGQLTPAAGAIKSDSVPYYIPQVFGQYNHLTIAQALGVQDRLQALHSILAGDVSEANMDALNDDWTIEERCAEALAQWGLSDFNMNQGMDTLSGGQKMKVFLAGIHIHQPELVLMDEPGNHLDIAGRDQLYDFICQTSKTLIIVSHDRKLLNLLNIMLELNAGGITTYGGNYDFYKRQKQIADQALQDHLQSREKALRKAKEKERETIERQQKLDARGKGKQEKAGVARIMMNTLRNQAESSTSKLKAAHTDKINGISQELQQLRSAMPDMDQMKLGFDDSDLHKGKLLFKAEGPNFSYGRGAVLNQHLNLSLLSGERVALNGPNGSGKTTLIRIILGDLKPDQEVYSAIRHAVYIDQEYSLIDNSLKVYEQAQQFNTGALQEHEIKIRLNWFLFGKDDWNKSCTALSGGERMRLLLCCLTISDQSPDLIVLDEPTNNLDIQNIEILTHAVNQYNGTLLVVSHDAYFLEEIGITRRIELGRNAIDD
ncbi:ABC-F family ATP-binding cassette domain-containing protein [Niabella yanshanensis]|uniref:ABC-F family ATP-binding cassette domain-containing protein n=1 Tax=Niabella yanshanensis TaxID=577386 RepID=A0ABZ0W1P6_9BACT|nr:ABC-F family ATP-binding cassette domain-containing protein [Niabella yanshanensis]WQD37006.1 ABC-F family ATP-binding cassette domain-containing protein [Niabella yanshanensis]